MSQELILQIKIQLNFFHSHTSSLQQKKKISKTRLSLTQYENRLYRGWGGVRMRTEPDISSMTDWHLGGSEWRLSEPCVMA